MLKLIGRWKVHERGVGDVIHGFVDSTAEKDRFGFIDADSTAVAVEFESLRFWQCLKLIC